MDKITKARFLICLLSIIVLLSAFFKQPYWYYQCIHWTICGTALFSAYYAYSLSKTAFVWMFSAVAIAFNPIAPFYFHRNLWQALDLVATAIFLASLFLIRRPGST